ncbi:hypothetical protein [Sporolactobacillus vineae]|uniref:hypothetical protein n=1 Tax=Sporolactobacillus vineae TaxID=444463 RepID=UPI0002897269|nr:hypothetical protein [Sporolactobacillus vineae]
MRSAKHKTGWCSVLIFLQLLLGVGAIFGGGALILSPDGTLLRIPIELLRYSPFHTFLIPGLILFSVLGVLPLIAAFFLITEKRPRFGRGFSLYKDIHWAWNVSLYIGFILIGWIMIEVYIFQAIAFIHVFYLFLGMAIQAVTLLPSVKDHYLISDSDIS